jgi:hypothetical protein
MTPRVYALYWGKLGPNLVDADGALDDDTLAALAAGGPHPLLDRWQAPTVRAPRGESGDLLLWHAGRLVSKRVAVVLGAHTRPDEGVRYLPVDVRLHGGKTETYYAIHFERFYDVLAHDRCVRVPGTDKHPGGVMVAVFDAARVAGHAVFGLGSSLRVYLAGEVADALSRLDLVDVELEPQAVHAAAGAAAPRSAA